MMQDATGDAFRLSLQQRTLWNLDAGAARSQAVCAVSIDGSLQPDVLREALHQVGARHEILRTTFQRPAGIKTPFQVVSPRFACTWLDVDASAETAPDPQSRVDAHFAREVALTADLEHAPLMRVTLIREAADRHVLVLSLPVMCADAHALANLTRELVAAYESAVTGRALSGDPLQYADYAQWQQDLLDGVESDPDRAARGKAYWSDISRAAVPPALPLRTRRDGARGFEERRVSLTLDSVLTSRIEAAAGAHHTTADVWLFACWQALLWRLAGEPASAFVVDRFLDGRGLDDLQPALGLFAKYLPVQADCRDERFAAHLRRVAEACARAEEWQDYADGEPVADATVAFEFNERPAAFASGGLVVSPLAHHVWLRRFTLTLSCAHGAQTLAAELRYNHHELDTGVVTRLAGYFERFVSAVVEDADRTLGEIDFIGDAEREHLLFALNQTDADFPRHSCIHQLFEEQAARTPDAPAVVAEPDEVTYGELNRRANQLAHLLRRHGVQPDVRVGLCMGRSVDLIVGLLGILKAGGAYVPLNPDHPAPRLALQLAQSDARVLVTSDRAAAAPPGLAGETIDLRRDATLLDAQPNSNPVSTTTPDNLVYVIYTSGSTGTPKGVGVRHRGLVNYAHFMLRRLAVDRALHFATISTITADLGNTCIFPAIVSGGCLHVLGSDVATEPGRFEEYVRKRPLDVLKIVPSHLSTLLVSQSYAILPSKYLVLGGEALPWELVERIARTGASCRMLNHYGPTEATVGCLTWDVDPTAREASLTVPIGRPIANMRAYILDSRLRPVPAGVTGELYVGGEGLAGGYVNDPAETAARFLPDPFVREPAARIYRTGDLARRLTDGSIEFLGRADHQVKVRGFRVEPGEIEAVLTQAPGVRDAVVVVRPGASGDSRLIAYVTAAASPLRPEALRGWVQERLPDYMVPSAFLVLSSMPLTPNGKVDRAALPPPDESRPELQRPFVAPRTPVERELSKIWAGLLNVKDVGVHDNFFDLGGHSLLATRVVSQMRRVFALEIPLGSLFASPTVAALAAEIERAAGARSSDLLVDVAELEQLSDEEADRLLSVEGRGNDPGGQSEAAGD